MDGQRFDELARSLAAATSRRHLLRAAAAGIVGALGAALPGLVVAVSCREPGRICREHADCCTGQCLKGVRRVCAPCPDGTAFCGGTCVPSVCPEGKVFNRRTCSCTCPTGSVECDGTCRPVASFQSDPANCGGCGVRCDDGNLCTIDTCVNGQCVHTPIECPAVDECHAPGFCDPHLGRCADGPATPGAPCGPAPTCRDGVAIGQGICTDDGTCALAKPVACSPYVCGEDVCLTACATDSDCVPGAMCNQDGQCVPRQENGGPCQQPNECASGHCVNGICCDRACDGACEACDLPELEGLCSPVSDVSCDAGDPCQVGTCQAGTCVATPKNCDDGDPCTIDTCVDGACVHKPVVCPPPAACHEAGVCNPETGACEYLASEDGTPCGAGLACCDGSCVKACPSGKVFGDGCACVCPPGMTACGDECVPTEQGCCLPVGATNCLGGHGTGWQGHCCDGLRCQNRAGTSVCCVPRDGPCTQDRECCGGKCRDRGAKQNTCE